MSLINVNSESKEEKGLTPKESKFLKCYFDGMTEVDSYLHLDSKVTRPSARVLGCRMLKRIKEKIDWPKLMEEAGLGEARLLQELLRMLRMKKVNFWQGSEIEGDWDDATIQLRATELLADLLGKRKHALDLLGEDGQSIAIKYEVIKPEEEEADDKTTSKN